MAQIFAGADRRLLDPEVLEAFKSLPDDFWVFAEFTISRNIDWFIVHPHPGGTLALIVIELKRTARPLAGDMNNTWRQWSPEGWRDLALSGPYRNYYWQAVEAANTLKEWLWNNQRRYRLAPEPLPQDAFKVWPDLLILSPPGTHHQLPLQPPNNFGRLLYSLDDCLRHVAGWKSRQLALVPLVEEEMLRLAEALGLERFWPPRDHHDRDDLLGRIRRLEERVRHLEAALSSADPPPSRLDWALSRLVPHTERAADPHRPPVTGRSLPGTEADPVIAEVATSPPPLETVFGWIEEALGHAGQGGPVRLANLGNALKSRYGLDSRHQFGIPLTELLHRAERAGRVRVSYRDRVPYAALAGDPSPDETSANGVLDPENSSVRQRLGKDGLMIAVRLIAAIEDAAAGRVVQTVSLLKHLRESLPLNGGPPLSSGEASRLLKREFVGMGYLTCVPVHDVDLDTGDLHVAEGYRLNRDHLAVQIMLETGSATPSPAIEIRTFATTPEEVPLPD